MICRNLLIIMGILNECMNREIQVWTIKDNYRQPNRHQLADRKIRTKPNQHL